MKNKEIEKILKYLKNNTYIPDETKRKYKILHRDEVNLLLSYIEQLKNNYIEANDSITWWTNRFNAVERDNRNLKNNRDKAIEYIKMHSNALGVLDTIKNYTLLDILGDKK